MNRKERRALRKQAAPAGAAAGPRPSPAAELLAQASALQRSGRPDQAARLYRRALAIEPDNAQAHNNLACALLESGQPEQASARFARALELLPQLFEQYADIVATLVRVNPAIGQAMTRAAQAWPRPLPAADLFGVAGLPPVTRDPMLRCLLQRATIRHLALEQVVTSLRGWLLDQAEAATEAVDDDALAFACALARQCFINEYVFFCEAAEAARADALRAGLVEAAGSDRKIPPLRIAAVAAYHPLGAVPGAEALLRRDWPPPVRALLRQQIEEPAEERDIAATLPRLTPIDDAVSRKVRRQYEENPYPRWVDAAIEPPPRPLGEFLRRQLPLATIAVPDDRPLDVLIAGCGTGRHSIEIATSLANARLLAIDLSLASLAYAARKTRAAGIASIDHAQADILGLRSIGRTFDVIDAAGVLHHMADPLQGWRVLLSLLRAGGVMHLGFYSRLGRRAVDEARRLVAERGDGAAPEVIRAGRRALLLSPARHVANFYDFFSLSECRDLLFHVQEHPVAIPDIKSFVEATGLTFLGFEVADQVRHAYAARFPADRAMTDLDGWHAFETANPDTFAGMYRFWVQKR